MKIERAGYKAVPLKTLLTTSVRNGYSPVCPEEESGNWVLGLGALNGNGLDPSQKKPAPPNDQKIQDFLLSKGDFLVSRSNTLDKVGRSSLFRGEVDNCAYPDLMMRFRVDEKKVNLEYLDTYLRTENIRHYFQIHAAGSSGSMVKITKSIVEETPISLPPLPEQEKIANFLGAVDARLTQLRRKRDRLQTYKRGVMQKIFSQEIRFKQDDGSPFLDWKKKTLSEIFTESYIKGNTGDKAKKLTVKLWGKGVFTKDGEGSKNTQYYIRKAGQFIYSKLDFLNCAFGIISDELDGFESTVDLPCFDITEGYSSKFLLLRVMQKDFYKYFGDQADGSRKAKRIHVETFLSFTMKCPCLEEQEKIANFLTAIDQKIEAISRQIDRNEQFKKGLLQKLFV